MSRLFTYVITADAGFAPNPFWGVCTLNCCKPVIRRVARVGDWVAANTPAGAREGDGKLVYAMQVTAKMTMQEYDEWARCELPNKIPWRSGDWRRKAGDAMYDFSGGEPPKRRPGFHDISEMEHDLGGGYTLLSKYFYYFGGVPVALPEHLQPVIHQGRAHKSIKNDPYVEPFVEWITSAFEANRVYNLPGDMPGAPQRVPFGCKP